MELSKNKILMASDGDKTYLIINGSPVLCEEFSFFSDGIDVHYSIKKAHPLRGFTADEFMSFIENDLGYKLSAE